MNLIEAREQENKRHDECMRVIDLVEEMGLEKDTTHCNGSDIYTKHNADLSTALRLFADKLGKYKQKSYYVCGGLAVIYYFEKHDVDVILYVPLSAIDQVSGGKCTVQERTATEKIVVCGIEGSE